GRHTRFSRDWSSDVCSSDLGQANWGKMDLALARVKEARAAGQQVGVDVYPYINNGLGIRALIHPRHAAQGQEALMKKLADPTVQIGRASCRDSAAGDAARRP